MLIIFCVKTLLCVGEKKSYLEEVSIGRVIGTNQKCILDYFLEMKAKMNFIFLCFLSVIDGYIFHVVRLEYKTDVHLLFLYFFIIKLV